MPNSRSGLEETDVDANPFVQFRAWLAEATAAKIVEAGAMTLATATRAGKPSARMVVLRGFDERGFVYYTNYESRKAQELADNPWASLVFYWAELHRQVRVEGRVEKVSAQESDAYFDSRPADSRLAASVSPQSRVIESREQLEVRLRELEREYAGRAIPRPAFWGGYRVIPEVFEFWHGQPSRLHDRLRYTLRTDGTWLIERLAP
jgi:pyridoxamine 5'-phosphate oxidase